MLFVCNGACVTGIVHFAGSTRGGSSSSICDEPTKYPYFTAGATPLFLSVVHSLHRKCPDLIPIPLSCFGAVNAIEQLASRGGVRVAYNPGFGKFVWPPQGVSNRSASSLL